MMNQDMKWLGEESEETIENELVLREESIMKIAVASTDGKISRLAFW